MTAASAPTRTTSSATTRPAAPTALSPFSNPATAKEAVILSAAKNPRICLHAAAALALFLRALSLYSQAPDAILRRVDDHYNHLSTLTTNYSEHYAGMGLDRTETGTLLLKKPGRMRWNYSAPAGKVFILDGKFGWFYTPGDNQATRIAAKKLDDLRSPLRFLLGHTQLQKELDSLTVTPEGADFRISGVPKGMAQRVKLLSLTVSAIGSIEKMRLEEIDGSVTEFTFSNSLEGLPIPDSTFRFTPPMGVSVVDGLPPI